MGPERYLWIYFLNAWNKTGFSDSVWEQMKTKEKGGAIIPVVLIQSTFLCLVPLLDSFLILSGCYAVIIQIFRTQQQTVVFEMKRVETMEISSE